MLTIALTGVVYLQKKLDNYHKIKTHTGTLKGISKFITRARRDI